jgi:hypothetical protein
MAFDLLKLQILQEAVDELRQAHPNIGICRELGIVISTLIPNQYNSLEYYTDMILPEVAAIIDYSVFIFNYFSDYDVSTFYLWPGGNEGKKNRIKYLERLIEDEMSGTYFMGVNHGI